MWVEHLVYADEVTADDVPVRVLEGQLQVVERVQPILQRGRHLMAVLEREAGDCVCAFIRFRGVHVFTVQAMWSWHI
ncbi:MAG: hypothetical protein WKF82_10230 [Nocardioidaceae bacterium]